jgi:tetratricopeptide (TPR) repeat protein
MPLKKQLLMLPTALVLLGACSMIPGAVSDAQYEFDEGMALFNSGRYGDAILRFQRATELDPNFGRAYLYLGRSYVSLKSWRQALTPLRTAYRLSPEETKREVLDILVDAIFAAGLDAFSSGDFESSIGYFKELLGLQPTSVKGRNEFIKALIAHGGNSFAKGNYPQAIAAYTEAVKLSPNSFEAVFGLAKSLFRNGEYSKALNAAQSAFKVDPGNREIQSFLQELRKQ